MLKSFDQSYASRIHEWACDSAYRRFFAASKTILNFNECANLPAVFQSEILFIGDEVMGIIGLASIKENPHDVYEIAFLIDKNFQQQGCGRDAYQWIEKYCRDYKNARMLVVQCSVEDSRLCYCVEKCEYHLIGVIEKNYYINGKFEDYKVYQKHLR